MQIFCRSDAKFCSKKGCGSRRAEGVSCVSLLAIQVGGVEDSNGTHLFGVHLGDEGLELGNVARVERKQQAPDKVVLGALERVQDRVHQLCAGSPIHESAIVRLYSQQEIKSQKRVEIWTHQLAKVVDRLPEQRRDSEVVRALDPLGSSEVLLDVDAGEVPERVTVVVGELGFRLCGKDDVRGAPDVGRARFSFLHG